MAIIICISVTRTREKNSSLVITSQSLGKFFSDNYDSKHLAQRHKSVKKFQCPTHLKWKGITVTWNWFLKHLEKSFPLVWKDKVIVSKWWRKRGRKIKEKISGMGNIEEGRGAEWLREWEAQSTLWLYCLGCTGEPIKRLSCCMSLNFSWFWTQE